MSLLASIIPNFSRSVANTDGDQRQNSKPSVTPVYEVKESQEAYGLTVHLPGVAKENLSITAEDGTLVVRGERSWKRPAGWTALYRESADLPYELVLEH